MTRAARGLALAVAAVALAVSAVAMFAGRSSEHRGAVSDLPRVQRAAPRPAGSPPLDRRAALIIARRFAAAYAAWDAGHRDARVARRLAGATTPDLFASLGGHLARPVARPPRRLSLRPAGAYRAGEASFVVPLLAHGRVHVVTLVVVPSHEGARVARLER